ncbi:MAG: late control D family protein [Methyloprofundus sp.]|nr:late control D family protein [Methyloprofundus sp.]
MQARRTCLKLEYEGTDISQDVAGDFISFDYSDNEDGKADDITVSLKDNQGLWIGAWFPGKGDTIAATIIDEGFGELYCGRFTIDELTAGGPPRTMQMKGVSIPINKTIRRQAKTKAWEGVDLSTIVDEVGATGGLAVIYEVDLDPQYDRVDQSEESDLAFLHRLCEEAGLSLKVTDRQLAVFEQQKFEDKEPIAELVLGTHNILSWSFESQAFDLYKECTVSYYDAKTETNIEKTFEAPNVADGMSFTITQRAESFGEAERIAKAALRKRNKHEVKANFTLVGDINMLAGVTVTLSGFGNYSGKYLIEKANHSISGGYTTKLDMRRVLEGY